MPFRKKALYYGLMLFLTLLALEGMARLAYSAAYGQWYGGGRANLPVNAILPQDALTAATEPPLLINHPFYGYTRTSPYHALNAMPPEPRREDTVVIALLGGSVAEQVKPFLQRALNRWFAANHLPRRPLVFRLATGSAKQPQQVIAVANTLLLGGEFDLIVNLDGYNEVALGPEYGLNKGVFSFFPMRWKNQVNLTAGELALSGRIAVLRREQGRMAAAGERSPLRWSAAFGLANRYQRERIEAEIIQLNHQLADSKAAYRLEKHGPRSWSPSEAELLPESARVWYRGSVALARLAELAGAEYYHFLQPNQYVPGAKTLSPEERESAYSPTWGPSILSARYYSLLTGFNQELQEQGINYFDLTRIFADHKETLYSDKCCHFNARGNELLAAAIVARLEPALRRLGGQRPDGAVSPLAVARRPIPPDELLVDAAFQVHLQGDGKYLRYSRADCAPGDVAPEFFLHLTPRDLADLPPPRREPGFVVRDFSFAAAATIPFPELSFPEDRVSLWPERCLALVPLPDYPLKTIRTGQYVSGAGELWAGSYSFPE